MGEGVGVGVGEKKKDSGAERARAREVARESGSDSTRVLLWPRLGGGIATAAAVTCQQQTLTNGHGVAAFEAEGHEGARGDLDLRQVLADRAPSRGRKRKRGSKKSEQRHALMNKNT